MSFAFYAFCLSLFLNLCILFLAKRFHLFIDLDTSNKPQRFHSLPTPRAGGIGIFAPFFFSLGFLSFYHTNPLLQGILWGGSIVFLSGIIEDFNASLSPKIRLILQCLGGGIFIYLSKVYLTDLGFGITLPIYLGIPFSIFAIVGIINAINIIDGFNGLASGLAMCALACIAFLLPSSPLSFVIFILLGGIFGFFVLNFPWGKIFLGDGGAYFLGFILSALLIIITQNNGGGGGERNLSVVWNSSSYLSFLGSDFFNLSQKRKNLCISSRQLSLASNPLSFYQNQNKKQVGKSPNKLSYSLFYSSTNDSTPSFLQQSKYTSYFLPSIYSPLSFPLQKTQKSSISPWFGIALLIYPFWEVIFSIYRKKFIRNLSPMQPDKLHLHMLIYKRITHNNAKTTLFVLSCVFPFMFLSAYFASQTWALCLLSLCFIIGYLGLYRKLVKFKLF